MALSTMLKKLQDRLGYRFKNEDLLIRALTHSSLASGYTDHNERLEFLGDRVLALVIVHTLYEKYPNASEGDMAVRLNAMVRKESCAEVARALDLGAAMSTLAGKRAPNREIFSSRNVLGDVCEAVLAAVYLDGGLEAARAVITAQWKDMLTRKTKVTKDPKSALQEWALGRGLPIPQYTQVSRSGPDHAPEFVMQVFVQSNETKTGTAASKREAEQQAAEALLQELKGRS